MNKKGGQAEWIEFIGYLLLSAIAITGMMLVVSKYVNQFSSTAADDFKEIAKEVEEVGYSDPGTVHRTRLTMDDDSAIIYFEFDKDYAEFYFQENLLGSSPVKVKKPSKVKNGMCLCRDFKQTEGSGEFNCLKPICTETDLKVIPAEIDTLRYAWTQGMNRPLLFYAPKENNQFRQKNNVYIYVTCLKQNKIVVLSETQEIGYKSI